MRFETGKDVRVPVNGLQINTRVDIPENAASGMPWMVFSNSLACATAMWDEQIRAFSSRFKTLRYDQRGHGKSEAPANCETTFEELAADLLALLAQYEIEKAVLVGVSMGATTVMRAAALSPSRVAAVVACDGQWRTPEGTGPMWKERVQTVRDKGMKALARPTVERWFLPGFITANPQLAATIEAMVAATPPEGYLACAHALQTYDYRADYPAIGVPVLYLVGANDGDMPKTMREMADATPGSQYRVIDECGHLPNLEQPAAFYAAVDGFVRERGIG